MRSPCVFLIGTLLLTGCASGSPALRQAAQIAQAQAVGHSVLIYRVQTKYLQNVSPDGGYTQIRFVNTGHRLFVAIAFEVVPYAHGEPVLQTASAPVLFGAKDDFEPGGHYTVTSAKPVWPADWRHPVDCVHLVGLLLRYADGQTERIGRTQISGYLDSEIIPQNCSNPSKPGPHN